MEKKFTITASPHVFHGMNTPSMMYKVCIALIPALIASVIFFGSKAVILIITCISACVLSEALFKKFRGRKISIDDGSALVTGLLLAMVIPPGLPVWMAILASVFAIGIGKEIFGGLGHNIFNPALLGRAFLSAAFPVKMTIYSAPFFKSTTGSVLGIDAATCATPLGLMKFEGATTGIWSLFLGNVAGSVGETSALALLIGGAYLLIKRYADWRIPAGFIGSICVSGGILHLLCPDKYPGMLFHLLAGGIIIGALFMATDPVTSPVTKPGRWIFGIGCGLLVIII
ncbi:MAG: RnfABCDGE type electron transport complex subunit D, partial [Candidatus Omnitrophota bacterium]|nr:RnfABCDGE type electron transport complex subunit D [Candidatus Omnitrophota bacterium]